MRYGTIRNLSKHVPTSPNTSPSTGIVSTPGMRTVSNYCSSPPLKRGDRLIAAHRPAQPLRTRNPCDACDSFTFFWAASLPPSSSLRPVEGVADTELERGRQEGRTSERLLATANAAHVPDHARWNPEDRAVPHVQVVCRAHEFWLRRHGGPRRVYGLAYGGAAKMGHRLPGGRCGTAHGFHVEYATPRRPLSEGPC